MNDLDPYASEKPYYFVCYARADKDAVLPLITQLSKSGYRIWYDQKLTGGRQWRTDIAQRILSEANIAVLAFLSPTAVESKWVRREIAFADKYDKPILYIYLSETDLPDDLDFLTILDQMVYCHKLPSEQETLRQLKKALQQIEQARLERMNG